MHYNLSDFRDCHERPIEDIQRAIDERGEVFDGTVMDYLTPGCDASDLQYVSLENLLSAYVALMSAVDYEDVDAVIKAMRRLDCHIYEVCGGCDFCHEVG